MNDGDGLSLEFNLPVEPLVGQHVDEGQLDDAIRQILHGADLEQLSRRMIRKQLEGQFHMDLSAYKDTINACILRVIEEQQQAEEEEEAGGEDDGEEEDEPEPSDEEDARPSPAKAKKKAKASTAPKKKAATATKRKRGASEGGASNGSSAFNMKLSLSPELAAVVGADMMARPQIVKALWEYIREHNLQDPSNKRLIVLDERLRGVFRRDTVTMFTMNKFVKRHVRKPDDLPAGGWDEIHRDGVSSDEDDDEKAAKKEKKAAAAKKKKKAASSHDDDEDGEKKPKRNPFNAELALSPELSTVLGCDLLPRPQIVKQLWEYIRAHNLQDPNDKRTIILDDALRRTFRRDTVTMFSINKYIKLHAMKPQDLPPGGWDDVPRDGTSGDEDDDGNKSKKKKAKQ